MAKTSDENAEQKRQCKRALSECSLILTYFWAYLPGGKTLLEGYILIYLHYVLATNKAVVPIVHIAS